MENSLMELWSIFDFFNARVFAIKEKKFTERYEKPIVREQDSNALKDLNIHIKPFILRRVKKRCIKGIA